VLEEVIGHGGFGAVHRAKHRRDDRVAAVKVLRAELAADAVTALRFAREIELLRSLEHPACCAFFDHGRLPDGRPYLAMELLRGETLAQHLAARGRLSAEEALAVVDPLAGALDAAHARGIVHRDLKPSNVFLAEERPRGRVVLLDFGVAHLRRAATLTASHVTVGAGLYVAPEQLAGSRVDARADVYALGALAYAMLTGRAPFGETTAAVLTALRRSAEPTPPSAVAPVDPALDAPVLRALARDPAARPALAGAFAAALRAAVRAPPPAVPAARARPALAVFAEVRVEPSAIDEGDELWRDDVEAALPLVWSELGLEGLSPVRETATTILLVGGDPASREASPRVIEAAARAYRRFRARAARSPVRLSIAVHAGELHLDEDGTLLPAGLLDTASWVPAAPGGVAASRAALAEPRGEPLASAPAFTWIER
jgi:serine/threonine-protein kinase